MKGIGRLYGAARKRASHSIREELWGGWGDWESRETHVSLWGALGPRVVTVS